jgi:transcriptional regulator with XRE-family HTH domain
MLHTSHLRHEDRVVDMRVNTGQFYILFILFVIKRSSADTPLVMNSFVKFHLQLAHAKAQEDAPTVEMPFVPGQSRVLKSVRVRHIHRHLLLANKNMARFVGQQSTDTDDPYGCVLRRLRTQQGLEAFVVASRACITVRQLNELETGKDSLFYTPGVRRKAAQRVAAILGVNWEDIVAGRVVTKAASGPAARLHLLKPSASTAHLKLTPPSPVSVSPRVPVQCQTTGTTPVSLAVFLRVADVQDWPVPKL